MSSLEPSSVINRQGHPETQTVDDTAIDILNHILMEARLQTTIMREAFDSTLTIADIKELK